MFITLTFRSAAYLKNVHTWSTTVTPPPKTPASGTRSTRARATKGSSLANVAQPTYTPPVFHPQPPPPPLPVVPPNPPRPPLQTTPQALHSTYASRLRTGTTLLMQPILQAASAANMRSSTRRGGVVNYADPGSGDDMPDAGAIDSDDSDFIASGGTRTAIRQTRGRLSTGMSVFHAGSPSITYQQPQRPEKTELDQSYLGMVPPSKFIRARPVAPTTHEYP
jgi:chromatin structure-remodeling complex subunit SFH1